MIFLIFTVFFFKFRNEKIISFALLSEAMFVAGSVPFVFTCAHFVFICVPSMFPSAWSEKLYKCQKDKNCWLFLILRLSQLPGCNLYFTGVGYTEIRFKTKISYDSLTYTYAVTWALKRTR